MGLDPNGPGEIAGLLEGPGFAVPVQVVNAAPHSLSVKFTDNARVLSPSEFSSLRLRFESNEVALGRCRYLEHPPQQRRANDLPTEGEGKLVFLDQLYDFAGLYRSGTVIELGRRLEQLPMLWSRKERIRPAFREFTAALVFDLQVYRGLFDEIDRNLAGEPWSVRQHVHEVVAANEYANFRALFDEKLARLEEVVAGLTVEEHERHGFYLRKHAWDIILASEFMRRTNLKPRGYPGDSQMMRMIYEDAYVGSTIFSRFVHRHPVQSAAAQAVRNRVGLLREWITDLASERQGRPMRIISVASGPAWELRALFAAPEDFGRFEVVLLDQDEEALTEARATVAGIQAQHPQTPLKATFVRESVRTMMRTSDLARRWGRFTFLYSMGLFDYLTAPVARMVLTRLYELLEPGGDLVIGNFHTTNPTRVYMEYWMDWVLIYRTEQQLLELASGLSGAESSVTFEATHSQMFLRVRKGAS